MSSPAATHMRPGAGLQAYLISSVELRWQRPRLEIPLPPALYIIYYIIKAVAASAKFFVFSLSFHTRTHPARQGVKVS